jgi:hypothetical protein
MKPKNKYQPIAKETRSIDQNEEMPITHWTPLNILLHVLPCDCIYLALYNCIQVSTETSKANNPPVLEKWLYSKQSSQRDTENQ